MIGSRHDMTDEQQQRMELVMPKCLPGPPRKDDRKVMDSIFFVLRTGMPWRDLPERYGPYTTCCDRFDRWSKSGRWQKILDDLQRFEEAEEEAADEKDDGDPHSPLCRRVAQGRRAAGDRAFPGRPADKNPCHGRRQGRAAPHALIARAGCRLRRGGAAS